MTIKLIFSFREIFRKLDVTDFLRKIFKILYDNLKIVQSRYLNIYLIKYCREFSRICFWEKTKIFEI